MHSQAATHLQIRMYKCLTLHWFSSKCISELWLLIVSVFMQYKVWFFFNFVFALSNLFVSFFPAWLQPLSLLFAFSFADAIDFNIIHLSSSWDYFCFWFSYNLLFASLMYTIWTSRLCHHSLFWAWNLIIALYFKIVFVLAALLFF